MPAALDRAEIWTTLACATGSRVAVLPTLDCLTSEAIEGKTATQRLTVTVPRDATAAIAELVPRRVIRLLFTDGAFEEYRIQDVVDSAQAVGVQVKANGVLFDLALGEKLLTQTTSPLVTTSYTKVDTATNLVTHALTFAPSYFSAGTVTPTATASVVFSDDTALSGLSKIADAMAAATGTTYELSARRNGTTGYYVDLTVLNSGATVPDIRTGKNLVSLRRTRSSRDQATRVYPVTSGGDGAAWFKVTAVSANTYIEIDTIDGSAVNPLIEDDCLNGKYWVHEDGVAHEITDTTRASKRLAMASTTGIAVGEWGYFALNSSKDVLRYVDYPSAQATSGVQAIKLQTNSPGVTNFLDNGTLANWTTATTTDWNPPFGTITVDVPTVFDRTGTLNRFVKETGAGNWLSGGASLRSLQNGYAVGIYQTKYLALNAGDTVTYTVWLKLKSFVGGSIVFYDPTAATTETFSTDGTVSGLDRKNEWLAFSKTYSIATSGSKTVSWQASLYGDEGYIDSGAITINGSLATPFLGSGGAQAWGKAVSYLTQNSTAPVTYEVSLLDLSRLDSGTWPYDSLALGGTVNVADSDLSLTASVRATQIERNHLNPLATKVTLATRPAELTSLLVTE